MTLSYKKGYKYKPGDLVQHRDKYYQSVPGIGVIVGPRPALLGPAYNIFWTKKGLCWKFEDGLEKVSK